MGSASLALALLAGTVGVDPAQAGGPGADPGAGGAAVQPQRCSFRLDFDSTLRLGRAPGGEPAELRLSVSGTWTEAEAGRGGGIRRTLVRLETEQVALADKAGAPAVDPGELQRLRSGLEAPFAYEADGRGRIVGAGLAADAHSLAQTTIQTVLGLTQRVAAASESGAWTTEEADPGGRFAASYRRLDETETIKRKLRYLTGAVAAGGIGEGLPGLEVLASEARFHRVPDGGIETVEALEHLRYPGSHDLPPAESETSLSLRRLGCESGYRALDSGEALALSWPARPLDAGASDRAVAADLDRVKTAGRSIEEALSRLGSGERVDSEERDRLLLALGAFLRLEPARAAAAVSDHLRAGGPGLTVLLSALGGAGTLEAQEVLLAFLDRVDASAPERLQALQALSLTPEPGERTLAFLESLLDDPEVGDQALLGLGSAAHRLRTADPARAAVLDDLLFRRLERAASPVEQKLALRALGNAGARGAVERLRGHLESEETAVAAEAVRALRRVGGPEVRLLLTGLLTASAPEVRRAAEEVLIEMDAALPARPRA